MGLGFGGRVIHVCDARDCTTHLNRGCLVVQLQELFRYLSETRPYETYVVTLPDAVA